MSGVIMNLDRGVPGDRVAIAATLRGIAADVERGRVTAVGIATVVYIAEEDARGIGTGVLFSEADHTVDLVRLLGAISVMQRRALDIFEAEP
jgi:hypothetical protein